MEKRLESSKPSSDASDSRPDLKPGDRVTGINIRGLIRVGMIVMHPNLGLAEVESVSRLGTSVEKIKLVFESGTVFEVAGFRVELKYVGYR